MTLLICCLASGRCTSQGMGELGVGLVKSYCPPLPAVLEGSDQMLRRRQALQVARIRVVGVGGGGVTAVNRMVRSGLYGVDFLTVDADQETLRESVASLRIAIGNASKRTSGLVGDAELGQQAGLRARGAFDNALHGSDMVFIVAGLGGGTGSGAAPILAQAAKEQGALVIAIVTYPFTFEGQNRAETAETGIRRLRHWADTLIVIPNDRLLQEANGCIGFHETYRLAHEVWHKSVSGISDLVNRAGLINVDFADVRSIMSEGGAAVIATGLGKGPGRARQAAEQATRSEVLGITIDGARGVLFNISGGPGMGLLEVEEAAAVITERVHPNANVIFGAVLDESLGDEVRITLVATGFGLTRATQLRPAQPQWQTNWLQSPALSPAYF